MWSNSGSKYQRKITYIQWRAVPFGVPLKIGHDNMPLTVKPHTFGFQSTVLFGGHARTQGTVFEHNTMPRQVPGCPIIRCITDKTCHAWATNHCRNLAKCRHTTMRNTGNSVIYFFVECFLHTLMLAYTMKKSNIWTCNIIPMWL